VAELYFLAAPMVGFQLKAYWNRGMSCAQRAPSVKITTHNRHRSGWLLPFKAFVVAIATRSAQSERPTPSLSQSQAAFYRGRRKSETRFVFAALTRRYPSPGPNVQIYQPWKTHCPCAGIMEVYS
jgi:hypothetical protein